MATAQFTPLVQVPGTKLSVYAHPVNATVKVGSRGKLVEVTELPKGLRRKVRKAAHAAKRFDLAVPLTPKQTAWYTQGLEELPGRNC